MNFEKVKLSYKVAQMAGWDFSWADVPIEERYTFGDAEEYLMISVPKSYPHPYMREGEAYPPARFNRYRVTAEQQFPTRERVLESAYMFRVFPSFETEAAAAFWLVDELIEKGFGFNLQYIMPPPPEISWTATFSKEGIVWSMSGETREIAICKAYLAVFGEEDSDAETS